MYSAELLIIPLPISLPFQDHSHSLLPVSSPSLSVINSNPILLQDDANVFYGTFESQNQVTTIYMQILVFESWGMLMSL